MGLVIKDRGVSLDGFGGEHLHGKPSMLSPDFFKNVIYQSRTSLLATYHLSLYGVAVMARPRNIV
jgi:hypothetical protein